MLRASPSPADISRAASASPRAISVRNVEASTTVTSVSRRATWSSRKPSSNSQLKVAATGMGSEIPVDSMTIWSNLFC